MCLTIVSPRAAALRVLAHRRDTFDRITTHAYSLAAFQEEAVARASQIIRRRGGVIIADSVGLGKTFIAAALLESALRSGEKCVVAIPSALKKAWQTALRPLLESHSAGLTIITHAQLSRRHAFADAGLVVVDEAHAFRSPNTHRYRALRRCCRGSKVVLLTATPVNNSLSDLYFQLRLYAADQTFRDIGIGSLVALLLAKDTDADALQRLRHATMIRRTRAQVRARSDCVALPDGSILRFPGRRELIAVPYPPLIPVDVVSTAITSLSFAAYRDDVTPLLITLSLLKRMQSSRHAFLISIVRLIDLHERFVRALDEGRLLVARSGRTQGDQLFFPELVADEIPPGVCIDELSARAQSDLRALQTIRAVVDHADDLKAARLIELLRERGSARTIVFTEFRDTAEDLWRTLRSRFQVGLITGDSAWLGLARASRLEVIRRFAPIANGAKPPPDHEAVHVLIATDVLAEGMNLQDADAVVSYDLPWNPVRLIQRAGRVDRIGSDHTGIKIYNFLPDREFDVFLGLVHRIRQKLADIGSAVGQETAVLDPDEIIQAFEQDDATDDFAAEEIAGAGPEGSIATLVSHPFRVLCCWNRRGVSRELIVDADRVWEDHPLADQIIRAALEENVARPFDPESQIRRSRNYLEAESADGAAAKDVAYLAREIQRAASRLGLLLTPEIAAEVDLTLDQLGGFLGDWRSFARRLRGDAAPSKLLDVLAEVRSNCSAGPRENGGEWTLIAVLGSD